MNTVITIAAYARYYQCLHNVVLTLCAGCAHLRNTPKKLQLKGITGHFYYRIPLLTEHSQFPNNISLKGRHIKRKASSRLVPEFTWYGAKKVFANLGRHL